MMDCQHASQLLSQSQDRPLPWPQRFGLRVHLMMCRACSRFASQLALLRQAATVLGRQVENDAAVRLSEDARDRISDRLRQVKNAAHKHPDQT